jgi:ABC-2 type transport system ATP-binding protein
VRAADQAALIAALQAAGLAARPGAAGVVLVEGELAVVGRAAFAAGIALTELRSAEGTGLEDMFLSLTADTQREGVAA